MGKELKVPVSLEVRVGKLRLRNPFILASGILSYGSLLRKAYESGAGAVVTKSLTLEPKEGYPTPVIVGFEGGLLNALGLANPGCETYLKQELPELLKANVPVIVSLAGSSEEEFSRMAELVNGFRVSGVELNLSCPHAEKRGLELGSDPEIVARIVRCVRSKTELPMWVKLGLCDSLLECGRRAEEEGADALVLLNTLRSMLIDPSSRRPILSNKFGGMSGPALKPVSLRCVYEMYEELSIPLIGCGGVTCWRDAVEYLLAGARAVQVGSAVALKGPGIFPELQEGLRKYLEEQSFRRVEDLVGLAHEG